ncbi:MAG TPA: LysM peptidoglycan-binding domain-containing protein [Myxococcota bacterium]|jgi:membrane-bound lytic murein transglycosylase D
MLRLAVSMLAAFGLLAAQGAGAQSLPRPDGLEPNVRFWLRIYSEVDTHGGLIHDAERLDVVYETVRFPSGLSPRERERRVEQTKRRYAAILQQLAAGNRSGLSAESERVLGLWPPGTSSATLRAAARNVRFQLGQADKFRAGLIRSGQWRAHIQQVLADEGVPVELVALPHVESSFNPRAYSHVGAAGLWQFMRSTGRRYMRVDDVVDERMDPHKASVAAARLLGFNYRQIDSWPLAITAYNHGLAGMARAVRTLGTRDIATIVSRYQSRSFGFASRNFYAEFLAASEIDRDPERYFGPLVTLPELEHEVVRLDHYYKVASLQRALGVDLETLREHNLALRPPVWSGAKYVPRGYELRVPKQHLAQPVDQLLASIAESERLAEQHRDRFYKVRRGDTLSKIAARQQTSERELSALNNLRSRNAIRVGQVLRLPDGASPSEPVVVASVVPMPSDRIHRVRRGDTLTSIARRYGVSEAEIASANRLNSRHVIGVGQRLRLPGAQEPLPASPPEPTVVTAKAEAAPAPELPAAAETPVIVPAPQPAPEPTPIPEAAPPAPEPPAPAPEAAKPPETPEVAPPSAPAPAAPTPVAPAPVVVAEAPREAPPMLAAAAPVDVPSPLAVAAPAPAPEPTGPPSPDPSNYSVSKDDRVTVQADETLGHYAEWLEVRPSALRRLNKMKVGAPVVIGRTAKLDFSHVTPEVFEERRLQYHLALQEEFFEAYSVSGTETHVLKRGESLWYLAKEKFSVPLWLLRQYNPDLDFGALRTGTRMVVPVIEPRDDQT